MLDYQTINNTLITIESSTNPDTMDLAGVPSVRDESEKKAGLFSKFLKNINKSRKKLSENLEKSKQNLSKNVGKSKENLEKNLDVSKKNLSKNVAKAKEKLGLNEPEGQVNKELLNKTTSNALGKYDFGKPNVKENLNLPKPKPKLTPKPKTQEPEHPKPKIVPKKPATGGTTTTPNEPGQVNPKPSEEHKEAAQGHLQKLLGQAKEAAENHPIAAGITGALAAGAGALGVKKLLNRKKKTA